MLKSALSRAWQARADRKAGRTGSPETKTPAKRAGVCHRTTDLLAGFLTWSASRSAQITTTHGTLARGPRCSRAAGSRPFKTFPRLKHSIAIGGRGRNDLEHVPMLDDLARLGQAEDVDPGIILVPRPMLEAVKDHVIALGQDAPELDALAGIFARHAFEIVDEGLLAVAHAGVVLDVVVAGIGGHGFG